MAFAIGSPVFKNGETIPTKFTGDGADVSPPLIWGGIPPGTKSLALICDDPDAPMGTWTHWVIYDIPASHAGLPEAVPPKDTLEGGAKHGMNTWPNLGYGGPSPPPGKPHRYFFKLYALKDVLGLPPGVDKRALLRAMEGKIIGQAEFYGTYGRKR